MAVLERRTKTDAARLAIYILRRCHLISRKPSEGKRPAETETVSQAPTSKRPRLEDASQTPVAEASVEADPSEVISGDLSTNNHNPEVYSDSSF